MGIVVPKKVFASIRSADSTASSNNARNDTADIDTETLLARLPVVLPAKAHRRPSKRSPSETGAQQARRAYHKARYRKVKELFAQGIGLRAISRQLHMGRMTVSRYLRLDLDPTYSRGRHAASRLDPYLPYLHHRWVEGCHNGAALWREVHERGYPHSRKMVAVWVAQQREQRQEPQKTQTSTQIAPTSPIR